MSSGDPTGIVQLGNHTAAWQPYRMVATRQTKGEEDEEDWSCSESTSERCIFVVRTAAALLSSPCWSSTGPILRYLLVMAACGGTIRTDRWLCSALGERPAQVHRQPVQPALDRRNLLGLVATVPELLWGHMGIAAQLVVSVDASAGGPLLLRQFISSCPCFHR